jgi:hypothetical protein
MDHKASFFQAVLKGAHGKSCSAVAMQKDDRFGFASESAGHCNKHNDQTNQHDKGSSSQP